MWLRQVSLCRRRASCATSISGWLESNKMSLLARDSKCLCGDDKKRVQVDERQPKGRRRRRRRRRRGGGGGSEKEKEKAQSLAWLPLLLAFLLCCAHQLPAQVAGLVQVPNRHTVASIPGDLVLGLLVPVHERPSPKQAQTRTCGSVREQYGIQRVEAAFRTIDSINADQSILANITLGVEIRDSCWHSPIALEQSIEFIRDAMAASELSGQSAAAAGQLRVIGGGSAGYQSAAAPPPPFAATSPSDVCQQPATASRLPAKKVKNLVGVVGPASSGDTVQVSAARAGLIDVAARACAELIGARSALRSTASNKLTPSNAPSPALSRRSGSKLAPIVQHAPSRLLGNLARP